MERQQITENNLDTDQLSQKIKLMMGYACSIVVVIIVLIFFVNFKR